MAQKQVHGSVDSNNIILHSPDSPPHTYSKFQDRDITDALAYSKQAYPVLPPQSLNKIKPIIAEAQTIQKLQQHHRGKKLVLKQLTEDSEQSSKELNDSNSSSGSKNLSSDPHTPPPLNFQNFQNRNINSKSTSKDCKQQQQQQRKKVHSDYQINFQTQPSKVEQVYDQESKDFSKYNKKRGSNIERGTIISDLNSLFETTHSAGAFTASTNNSTEQSGHHGLAIVIDSFIKWIKFQQFRQEKNHTSYIIRVRGRTKFMKGALADDYCQEFTLVTRYSELVILREQIEKEIRHQLSKDHRREFKRFPKFPGKKFYNKMDKSFVEKRMMNLDIYFEEMFGEFPEIMKYSQALLDFCKPKDVQICLMGSQGCGKTSFIQAVCRDFHCLPAKLKKKRKNSPHGKGKLQFRKSKLGQNQFIKTRRSDSLLNQKKDSEKSDSIFKTSNSVLNQSTNLSFNTKKKILPNNNNNDSQLRPKSASSANNQVETIKVFPIDIVVKDILYRLDIRQFTEQQVKTNLALNYCKKTYKDVIFVIDTHQKGSSNFIKPYIKQWITNQRTLLGIQRKDGQILGRCAIVVASHNQTDYIWRGRDTDVDEVKDMICGGGSSTQSINSDQEIGFFCELSLDKLGDAGMVIKTLIGGGRWFQSMKERRGNQSSSEEQVTKQN